jgi:hypothetical protein
MTYEYVKFLSMMLTYVHFRDEVRETEGKGNEQ